MKINNDGGAHRHRHRRDTVDAGNSAAAAADDVLQSWNCNNHLLNFV